jgi:hypothetical protein
LGSLFSDLGLLRDYQKTLKASGKGPPISQNHLEAYLRAEQKLGRVRADADVTFYSELMLGFCFQRAFREKFMGSVLGNKVDGQESDSIYAGKLAESMARVLVFDPIMTLRLCRNRSTPGMIRSSALRRNPAVDQIARTLQTAWRQT